VTGLGGGFRQHGVGDRALDCVAVAAARDAAAELALDIPQLDAGVVRRLLESG
jgi:hypothetical protein